MSEAETNFISWLELTKRFFEETITQTCVPIPDYTKGCNRCTNKRVVIQERFKEIFPCSDA